MELPNSIYRSALELLREKIWFKNGINSKVGIIILVVYNDETIFNHATLKIDDKFIDLSGIEMVVLMMNNIKIIVDQYDKTKRTKEDYAEIAYSIAKRSGPRINRDFIKLFLNLLDGSRDTRNIEYQEIYLLDLI